MDYGCGCTYSKAPCSLLHGLPRKFHNPVTPNMSLPTSPNLKNNHQQSHNMKWGGMWKDTINNVMAKIRIKASSCFQTQSLKHFLSSLTCIYSVENLFCLLIIFFHLPDTHCIYMIHVWTCKVTVSFNTWSNLQIISRNTLSDNEHSSHINIAHLNIDIIKLFGQFVICQVNQHFLCILPDILHVSLSLKLLWTRNKLGSFLFVS